VDHQKLSSLKSETDADLIQGCRRGDERAWERVLDRYERLIYSIALKHGLSVDEAADITQITFTILLQSLDSLREDTRLAAWLSTVAKRHVWRRLDKRRREQVSPEEDLASQDWSHGDSENPIRMWEQVEWLRDGLQQLDERCRQLLTCLYFEAKSLSYQEVASRFSLSVGSVGPTRARCLERLKSIMAEVV
jgi:RNA polymerase sigma factor (sigma-70 family)